MKKIIVSTLLMFVVAIFSSISAQQVAPPGAGDTNLQDNNIKMRSVELERVKREAGTIDAATFAPINRKFESKFPQIKEDFESIQNLQGQIIKAYTMGEKINYSAIETAAFGINENAKRLDSNLFATKFETIEGQIGEEKVKKTTSIRDLIVELDNAVGSFVSSKIFANAKTLDAEAAIQTRIDLNNVRQFSQKLAVEAKKMK